jgi:hypothetical protein
MRAVIAWLAVCVLSAFGRPAAAQPATLPPAGATPASRVTPVRRNVTRVESWRFFDPPADGGNPDYAFAANRLLAGLRVAGRWYEATGALQYVQFGGLPDDASGPGALGTGGSYFDHNRRRHSGQVYLQSLNVIVRPPLSGLTVRAGRMGYASGSEGASGDPALETLKRLRLHSRLVGEFEWSRYQRAFDGVRGDWTRDRLQVTGGRRRVRNRDTRPRCPASPIEVRRAAR